MEKFVMQTIVFVVLVALVSFGVVKVSMPADYSEEIVSINETLDGIKKNHSALLDVLSEVSITGYFEKTKNSGFLEEEVVNVEKTGSVEKKEEYGPVKEKNYDLRELTPSGDNELVVFADKKNDFTEGVSGLGFAKANGRWVDVSSISGDVDVSVSFIPNTTKKDSENRRDLSTFYLLMWNESGETIGGHFFDPIITDKDYGKRFEVGLSMVKTSRNIGDIVNGRNPVGTNFSEFLKNNDKVFVVSFYNATKWARLDEVKFTW